jgi:hypothetical protein
MYAIRDALEINPIGTVFERPGEVAPLPAALRDPKPFASAKRNKDGFFALLEAKATSSGSRSRSWHS